MMIISPTLHAAQQHLGQFNLADVLFSLNRACMSCEHKTLSCELPFVKSLGLESGMFQWAAAETARLATRFCRLPAYDRVGETVNIIEWKVLENIIGLATEVLMTDRLLGTSEAQAQVTSGDPWDTLHRIMEPQYVLRRNSPYRMAQPILMYHEAAARRAARDRSFNLSEYQTTLRGILGCSIKSLVLAVTQIRGKAQGEHPLLTANSLIPIEKREYDGTAIYAEHSSGMITPAVGDVLRLLSETPTGLLRWMASQRAELGLSEDPLRSLLESPNPLLRYPLIRVFRDRPDYCISPVPHLVNEWLYEPLASCVYEAVDTPAKTYLNYVFEEYVGMLLEICSPDGRAWHHENELKPPEPRKVIDWAREFDDTVLLVDAKRAFVSLAARYRSLTEDWTTAFQRNWAKAVIQGTDFWNAVQQGQVPLLAKCRTKRPLLLIVTLSDTDSRAGRADLHNFVSPHLPADLSHIPYAIVSIHRLEHVVSNWEKNGTEWLPHFVQDAVVRGSTQAASDLPSRDTGRLADMFSGIFAELTGAVEAATLRPRTSSNKGVAT